MASEKTKRFFKTLGPGIMFAGTCIGGSHLVQSTRAGAGFGFDLLLIVLLANIMKYPFFEFASRYTNVTGHSIISGYKKLGRWTLWLYLGITVLSMFIITAAIGSITSGLITNLTQGAVDIDPLVWTGILYVVVALILISGRFSILDTLLKVVGIVLVISVLVAFFSALSNGPKVDFATYEGKSFGSTDYLFLISLMGWMPIAVDMSTWHSLWTQERIKQTKYHPTLKETLTDFNIGYIITVVLAVCFLTLGAYVFYGSGEDLPPGSTDFAHKLVTMFTSTIGQWSYWIIAAAAFSTMFGTSVTLIDGYCRSLERTISLLKSGDDEKEEADKMNRGRFNIILIILVIGAFAINYMFSLTDAAGKPVYDFKVLVDLATTISFLIAPVAAVLNLRIIFSPEIPEDKRPSMYMRVSAVLGIMFLSGFTLFFFYVKFIG